MLNTEILVLIIKCILAATISGIIVCKYVLMKDKIKRLTKQVEYLKRETNALTRHNRKLFDENQMLKGVTDLSTNKLFDPW